MPHKKNPDVLELIRAKAGIVESNLFQVDSIVSKLLSGYNRDAQLTKEPLINSFEITLSCIDILKLVIDGLKVNKENCISAFNKDIFATDCVIELVKKGVPLREAYQKVAKNIEEVKMQDPIKNIQSKKHIGATGNLGLDKLKQTLKSLNAELNSKIIKFSSKLNKLVS